MLYFYRPAFKAGMMVIEDQDPNGKIVKRIMKPSDNEKNHDFIDEAFVAAKYPEWFLSIEKMTEKKQERSKARKEKRTAKA